LLPPIIPQIRSAAAEFLFFVRFSDCGGSIAPVLNLIQRHNILDAGRIALIFSKICASLR
jgi:hypothetical protein